MTTLVEIPLDILSQILSLLQYHSFYDNDKETQKLHKGIGFSSSYISCSNFFTQIPFITLIGCFNKILNNKIFACMQQINTNINNSVNVSWLYAQCYSLKSLIHITRGSSELSTITFPKNLVTLEIIFTDKCDLEDLSILPQSVENLTLGSYYGPTTGKLHNFPPNLKSLITGQHPTEDWVKTLPPTLTRLFMPNIFNFMEFLPISISELKIELKTGNKIDLSSKIIPNVLFLDVHINANFAYGNLILPVSLTHLKLDLLYDIQTDILSDLTHLETLDVYGIGYGNSFSKFPPNLKKLIFKNPFVTIPLESLPKKLEYFDIQQSLHYKAYKLLPRTLTELTCRMYHDDADEENLVKHFKMLPPNLTKLTLKSWRVTIPLLNVLPSSLRVLQASSFPKLEDSIEYKPKHKAFLQKI
jgi:hypothetical protein